MGIKRQQVIRNAEKYVAKGRIEAGIEEYRKVLAENPNDTSTLNRVGDLYARISRIDEAIRLFHQIAEQYQEDGFFVKAIAIYKKIIKLDPTRLPVYEKLAELYHRQGLLNEARTQYNVLADYYLKHEDPAAAINIYQKMVELEPSNPSHHLKLAELYEESEIWDNAMREYRIIAELMLEHERQEEAVRVYERAIERRPEDIGFITDAVLGLKDAGHTGSAARLLTRAVELNPRAERVAQIAGMQEEPPAVDRPLLEQEPPPTAGEPHEIEAVEPWSEGSTEPPTEHPTEPAAAAPAPRSGTPSTSTASGEGAVSETSEPAAEEEIEPESVDDLEFDESEGAYILEIDDGSELEPEDGPRGEGGEEMTIGAGGGTDLATAAAVEEEGDAGAGVTEADIHWDFEDVDDELEIGPPPETEPPDAGDETHAAPSGPSARDLLAEAEVLAKYGLEDKALDRLRSVVGLAPRDIEAHELMASIYLRQEEHRRAAAAASRVRQLAPELDEPERWERLEKKLVEAGFRLDDRGEVEPPEERDEEVAGMLESLVTGEATDEVSIGTGDDMESLDVRLAKIAAAATESVSETSQVETRVEEPVVPEPIEASEPPEPEEVELESEEGLAGITLPEEGEPDEAELADEPGVDWLREAEGEQDEESLFDDEEEFFDLAAELEQELDRDRVELEEEFLVQQMEPTLEEIVEGFKRGVAENLSEEDFDTHYNLGIAYREMGLLDEAIGEFQIAAKDPAHLVSCCSMLGVSFIEKGLPELAVKWYRRGLEAPDVSEETTCNLLYEMGNAHLDAGDEEAAYRTFVELYGVNSNYRDVVAKLEELGHGRIPRHVQQGQVESERDVE